MSTRGLLVLVGKAVVSDQFRAGILNGRRAELISGFDLEPEETAGVMAIRAADLVEFAAAVESMIAPRERSVSTVYADRSAPVSRPRLEFAAPSG
jgi:hypothetical protein